MKSSEVAGTLLPEVREVLEHNGIDWRRCSRVSLNHEVEKGRTWIEVRMVALAPALCERCGEGFGGRGHGAGFCPDLRTGGNRA